MFSQILLKSYHKPEISRLEREIKAITREVRHLETGLRKMRNSSPPPAVSPKSSKAKAASQDFEARKRFASYLSTGSFQTIRAYKFKSDLIRKRRLLWASAIIIIIMIVILLFRFL